MEKYILYDPDNCTGCGACADVCPKNCIEMISDEEGFYIPFIDTQKCINCGMCKSVCQLEKKIKDNDIRKGYGAICNLKEIGRSSSGGAFYGIAVSFFNTFKNGLVYGATFFENNEVKHIGISKKEELYKLQGSKYVQSNTTGIFEEIKNYLKQDIYILFTGTPCQVAALKEYVGKYQEKLYTIDLICHGCPSPGILKKHLSNLNSNKNDQVISVSFREKNKFMKCDFVLNITYSSGKKIRVYGEKDWYYNLFLNGRNFRESCYNCKYTKKERVGDITIGDVANKKLFSDFNNEEALSTILINTDFGEKLWEISNKFFRYKEADIEEEVRLNHNLHSSTKKYLLRKQLYTEAFKGIEKKDHMVKIGIREKLKYFILRHISLKNRNLIKRNLKRIRKYYG